MIRLLRNIVLLAASLFAAVRLWPSRKTSMPERVSVAQPEEPKKQAKGRLIRLGKHVALFIAVLIIGGLLVAVSGIVPIKASSGHWAITRWFMSFSMARSVATHTLGLTAPALDDPGLVLKGAGHYETGCRPCHGSPVLAQPRIAGAMTPHPPYLPPVIPQWEDDELFYIVKHGVKFTGMPAWPALHRDDEVWAMVAFLRRLPDLDAAAYQHLAHGPTAPTDAAAPILGPLSSATVPEAVAESCGRCHGLEGLGRGEGAFPRLAGQRPVYLYTALQAYARGERRSGIMEPVAAGLSDDAMQALARYYARLDTLPPASAHRADPSAIERGEEIASRGIPSQGVPSCVDCHGPSDAPRNPAYPVLAGQYADYLVLQLDLFKKKQRGGSAYAHIMHPIADRLTNEQMRDVALYYASLAGNTD